MSNGTRRGFDSYPTFLKLGLYNELGVALYNAEAEQIPVGATISSSEISGGIGKISKYYLPIVRAEESSSAASSTIPGAPVVPAEIIAERIARRERLRNNNNNTTITTITNGGAAHSKCERNETIEALVRSNGTRCILYLVAHDSDSEHAARKFSHCRESWMQPVRINSTVFFESVLYRDVFPPYQQEWENVDYVVTATYKTVGKQLHYNKYTQSLDLIYESLRIARDGQYDIVPFLRSGSGTMSFCTYFHGKQFKAAWDALLMELGYTLPLIRSLYEIKSFYRNIYVIKPKILKELMGFMSRAMQIATNNPTVRALLQVDSKYKEGSEEVAMRIFGTKYYQLHPFIFERLPSFYLHASNAKICAATAGPCPYNS